MARVYLGLGSNLGDREANLREALRRLRSALRIDAVSSVYASEPVGYASQPDFLNLVACGETELRPEALLARIKKIERAMGRKRSFRNAPRPIDIDILLYGDLRVRTASLELPHPRMLERAFVLRPLAELAPALRHPRTGRSITEHLSESVGLERTERLFPGARLLDEADRNG